MTLGLVYDDSVMSELLKANDNTSMDHNPYINWVSETNVCPSMALHVIDIDIGSKSHIYWNMA